MEGLSVSSVESVPPDALVTRSINTGLWMLSSLMMMVSDVLDILWNDPTISDSRFGEAPARDKRLE